jgi:hypothetical protein
MPAEAWHHFNGAAETKRRFKKPAFLSKYLPAARFHDVRRS